MSGAALSVLGVAGLLAVAVATEPISRRIDLPHSLVLIVAGAFLGLVGGSWDYALSTSLTVSSETFLYLFLPVLLFETAIQIDVRRLLDEIGPILLLAVVAVLASTFVVGFSMSALSSHGLIACLLLASIVSTTDPVAVVALFKNLSVPHRLTLLVEGESLFNDAAAIALFSVLMAMLTTGTGDWGQALVSFARGFAGGLLVGVTLATVATSFLRYLPGMRMAEVSVTVSVAYLAFVAGEHGLHVSGVVAVVAAALVFAYDGRTRVSPETWSFLVGIWRQLGYWASCLVFLLAALHIPDLLAGTGTSDLALLGILVVSALAARGLVLFGMLPLLSAAGLAEKVERGLRLVILWGGLRGAISLALALAVVEHPGVPEDVKRLVATLVTAFVLFTLFVNGLTLRPIIRRLGLDRLGPVDVFLRKRAIAHGLGMVGRRLDETVKQFDIDPAARDRLSEAYGKRLREAETVDATDTAFSDEERLRASLVMAARHEQALLFQFYQERIVSGRIVRNLLASAYHLEDRAKSEGHAGYATAAREQLAFRLPFRLAMQVQRRLGWQVWLSRGLADRLESLIVGRAIVNQQLLFAAERIPAMLGQPAGDALAQVLQARLDAIESALTALDLQYGEFSRTMQTRYLERAALRIESAECRRLFDESVIGQEVLDELRRDLDARWRIADRRPPMDLRLDPKQLLARVPLFQNLDAKELEEIKDLLGSRFVVPGDRIIHKGEKGREMFFLVSGAVEVAMSDRVIRLGSGDFFGEVALIAQTPRTADVTALGYCELLVLAAEDLTRLMSRNPDLDARVSEMARIRLARG